MLLFVAVLRKYEILQLIENDIIINNSFVFIENL